MIRRFFTERAQPTRMHSWNRLWVFPALVTMLLVTGCETMQSEKSITEVRAANDAYYSALIAVFRGDIEPMEKVWSHSDDVTYLPPSGDRYTGWKAVRDNWQKQADLKLGGSIEGHDIRVVIACPTVAIVTARSIGSSPNVPNGPMEVDIRSTNVYRRESGEWKMILHQADKLPKLKAAEHAAE